MARLETKVIQVAPADVNGTINVWQRFGWVVCGTQEIYSNNSHVEKRDGEWVNVTSVTNYSKITFQRDRDMDYYNEICALEKQFYSIQKPQKNIDTEVLLFLGAIASFIVAVVFVLICCFCDDLKWLYAILAVLFAALGIIAIVFCIKIFNKNDSIYREKMSKYNETRSEILRKAASFV